MSAELLCRRTSLLLRPYAGHVWPPCCSRSRLPLSISPPVPNIARPRFNSSSTAKPSRKSPKASPSRRLVLLASAGVLSSLSLGVWQLSPSTPSPSPDQDTRDPSKPRYRLTEIRKHDSRSGKPWVTRGDKVYDITDWVAAHPGGDVILRAAGASIDPYWDIFTIHRSRHVEEILEQYCIGFIHADDLVDGAPAATQIEDPFADDPKRDPRLIELTARPQNAETPRDLLAATFLTPSEVFYVRNHMWVPRVDGDGSGHTLTVELPDGTERTYTLDELRGRFKTHKITATLQCSGNRRRDMTAHAAPTNGLQWDVGAISCAEWEGVRLSDILSDAGLDISKALAGETDVKHVQFSGLEAYGASIPVGTALDPRGDVLLAFSMNGAPLPRDHGFPLRALVPGHVAARSVKWLSRIVLSDEESTSQWQKRDYKCFGPNEGAQPDWDRAAAIQEMPVTSAITSAKLKDTSQKEGEIKAFVEGYAYAGGGRAIRRVDVSLDDGRTWDQAELLDDCAGDEGGSCLGHKTWAWRRWRYKGVAPLGEKGADGDGGKRCTTVLVKATDDGYNSQPEHHASIYNVRGNLANAWHRVSVCAEGCGKT